MSVEARRRLRVPLIVWGLALIGAGSLVLTFGIPLSTNAAARAERLRPIGAAAVRSRPERTDVLVEGRISPVTPAFDSGLVAFRHERYRKMYDLWEESEVRKPELLIELGDGAVRLAPGTYMMEQPSQRLEDSLSRYVGFRNGDTVMVIGGITQPGDTPVIRADVLYGGDREEYIADQKQRHIINRWLAPVLLCGGALLITVALVLRWRPGREEEGEE